MGSPRAAIAMTVTAAALLLSEPAVATLLGLVVLGESLAAAGILGLGA